MTQPLTPTIETTLLGAADLLRKNGWTTLHEFAPDGRMCLLGALQKAAADSGLYDVAATRLMQTIWSLPSGAEHPSVSAWNDRHCSSLQEAIDVLERAAGLL